MSISKRSAVLLACAAVVIGACTVSLPNVINGSGSVRTEQRTVGAFTRVEIKNGIRLELSIGSPATVEVTAQENLLTIVASTVSGERLTVAATQNYNSVNGIVLRIVMSMSAADDPAHRVEKISPTSAGASRSPSRSSRWQLAHAAL